MLIVTVDEKEYLRLGLLLEQVFPGARIQMVSTVINPKGATRSSAFGRTDEYVYFVMIGDAAPPALPLTTDWKVVRDARAEKLRWAELLRAGTSARREDRPGLFYPVFLRNGAEGPVEPVFVPGTQWRIPSHEAGGSGGTNLLRGLLPGRRFPFPKSLYAVEDAIRLLVADKPGALILDYFPVLARPRTPSSA